MRRPPDPVLARDQIPERRVFVRCDWAPGRFISRSSASRQADKRCLGRRSEPARRRTGRRRAGIRVAAQGSSPLDQICNTPLAISIDGGRDVFAGSIIKRPTSSPESRPAYGGTGWVEPSPLAHESKRQLPLQRVEGCTENLLTLESPRIGDGPPLLARCRRARQCPDDDSDLCAHSDRSISITGKSKARQTYLIFRKSMAVRPVRSRCESR